MHVKVTTETNPDDNRAYVIEWVFVPNNPVTVETETGQYAFHVRDVPKDFYRDSWKWYVKDLKLRKNTYYNPR